MNMDIFAPLDYIIFIIMIFSMLIGLIRGLFYEFLSILSWFIAFYTVVFLLPYIQPFIAAYLPQHWISNLAIFIILFIVLLFLFSFITGKLTKKLHRTHLNLLDHFLGLFFGTIRGGIIIISTFLVLQTLTDKQQLPHWIQNAYSFPYILKSVEIAKDLIPLDRIYQNLPKLDSLLSQDRLGSFIESQTTKKNMPNLLLRDVNQ